MESLDTKNDIAFIDSHCHLQDYANEDLNDILNSCSNINLKIFYSNSTSEADFQKNLDISQNQEILKKNNISKIIYGIGYHPWSLNYPLNNKEKWFHELVEFINEYLIFFLIKFSLINSTNSWNHFSLLFKGYF